jgi:hypothetical protein
VFNLDKLSLYLIFGGILEVPISFTHNSTGEKLDLTKIFKEDKIDIDEIKKHPQLFSDIYGKLNLNPRSDILKNNYHTPQIYISPHDLVGGTTLKDIINDLESRGINQFTIFITTCKYYDSDTTEQYKYFDLKEYMDYLKR